MVTPRKFTGTEWHDLARGCRILATRDAEEYQRRIHETGAERYLEFEKIHREMAELCEHWGDQQDHKDMLEKRARLAEAKKKERG